jgi:hypothetical protein
LLRNSITLKKAGDEVEKKPGFLEIDTVAHCGPTTRGQFIRTVNFTDMFTGWTISIAILNNARANMLPALDQMTRLLPFPLVGFDTDNGSEFINNEVVDWVAAHEGVLFTRSRPYRKNDNATIESKNNWAIRRFGSRERYETAQELTLLNQLWELVTDKLNYFTPTIKPIRWDETRKGRRKRIYDQPATPFERLTTSGILAPEKITDMENYKNSLNLAGIIRQIHSIQHQLLILSSPRTSQLVQEIHSKQENINTLLENQEEQAPSSEQKHMRQGLVHPNIIT